MLKVGDKLPAGSLQEFVEVEGNVSGRVESRLGRFLDLDREAIAVRAGHHCTQPLHERLGEAATARASCCAATSGRACRMRGPSRA